MICSVAKEVFDIAISANKMSRMLRMGSLIKDIQDCYSFVCATSIISKRAFLHEHRSEKWLSHKMPYRLILDLFTSSKKVYRLSNSYQLSFNFFQGMVRPEINMGLGSPLGEYDRIKCRS